MENEVTVQAEKEKPTISGIMEKIKLDTSQNELEISSWKDQLSELSTQEMIEMVQKLNSSTDYEIGDTLIPNLSIGLNSKSIDAILSSLNRSYTEALSLDKNITDLREKERNQVIGKLQVLYNNYHLHNRILLGIFLQIHNNSPEVENYEKNFLKNIKDRLFTGQNTKELREKVIKTNELPNEGQEIAQVLQG